MVQAGAIAQFIRQKQIVCEAIKSDETDSILLAHALLTRAFGTRRSEVPPDTTLRHCTTALCAWIEIHNSPEKLP